MHGSHFPKGVISFPKLSYNNDKLENHIMFLFPPFRIFIPFVDITLLYGPVQGSVFLAHGALPFLKSPNTWFEPLFW